MFLFLPHSHRHQDDHKCEKLVVQKPRMEATKELVQKIIGQSRCRQRENFFCHSFVCPHGISIKQNDLIFVITHVRLFVFVQPCLHIYSVCLRPCDHSESKDGSKSKGRRGAKNSATAAKVALMKLKLHAAGDKGLPQVHKHSRLS